MSVFQYKSGMGNSAAYQVSSIPYATAALAVGTSSVVDVDFPAITKFVTVRNDGANELRFGFSSNGVQGTNYISLDADGSFTGDFKLGNLYLIASGGATTATVIAGITGVQKPVPFTNWSGSAGVG